MWAMILNNYVIDLVNSDTMPNYPPDPDGNIVSAVNCDENVYIGMYYDGNTFFWKEQEIEPEPQPTQLDRVEENQLIIMEAMAEQYEDSVEKDLMNMEVQATIYESILALGGEV